MAKKQKNFIPILTAEEVNEVLKRHTKYKLPVNVDKKCGIKNWYKGIYYGYGDKESWIPLNEHGGMATKAFHNKTVRFPKRIETKLMALLDKKKYGL